MKVPGTLPGIPPETGGERRQSGKSCINYVRQSVYASSAGISNTAAGTARLPADNRLRSQY